MPEHSAKRLPPLIVVAGPTAVGKTALALELARHCPLEIISADSRQVYRLMDIGTAKPTAAERAAVPHHLLDVVWPDESFDAARFAVLAATAADQALANGRLPLLVGGTGLYIKALCDGLAEIPGADPAVRARLLQQEQSAGIGSLYRDLSRVDAPAAAQLHPHDLVRIVRALEVFELTGRPLSAWQQAHGFRQRRYRVLKIGLMLPREELYQRIDQRAAAMLADGLLEETERLLQAGYAPQLKSLQTIGYREAVQLLRGGESPTAALAALRQATRRYAKRQLTWFRADPEMIWVDSRRESDKILTLIERFHDT